MEKFIAVLSGCHSPLRGSFSDCWSRRVSHWSALLQILPLLSRLVTTDFMHCCLFSI